MLSSDLKSRIVTNLVKDIPGFMSTDNIRNLTTDPKKAIFGYEDAADAIQSVEISEKEKGEMEKRFDSNSLKDLFPNARLTAELDIIKETNRTKYKEFTDTMLKLDNLAKEIDTEVGSEFDFLLDEIKQYADPEAVDTLQNMKTTIIEIEKK